MTGARLAARLLGWRPSSKNRAGWQQVPNNADVDNRESLVLAAEVLHQLELSVESVTSPPSDPGSALEHGVRNDLVQALAAIKPGRRWRIRGDAVITDFSQYAHLLRLDELARSSPTLSTTIGRDYLIRPDVTVAIENVPTTNNLPLLHAAVSCKWTIRSDRVQNIRHENNQMVRHRRGRQPHLVAVTAEPLPSRLASIARGTGEVDAVYHIAYSELATAVAASNNAAQQAVWAEITSQGRLLDYGLLALHLASW